MNNEEKKKEYQKFMNEQLEILKRHHERIMLRLLNKFNELFFHNIKEKER